MGHSLGKIKDAYIFQCEGGDQLCGRMISGLPFDDKTFATLPPHFPTNILERLDNEYWNDIIPGYDTYPGVGRIYNLIPKLKKRRKRRRVASPEP